MANTTIPSELIADGSVVTAKIANDAVDADKLASNAVVTASIADDAVTLAKMAANSIDSDQYVDGSIDTIHIADGAITSAKLDTNIAVGGTLNVSGAFTSLGIDDNADATAITIDSSENVLVGKSASGLANAGIELTASNILRTTKENSASAEFNRTGTDGDIAIFWKNTSPVGSIGTAYNGSRLAIGKDGHGLGFVPTSAAIIPHSMITNQNSNGTTDLGTDGVAFRNLYLSGGVYLGGTGAANKLDDYEEGTWTPNIQRNGGTIPATFSTVSATYVKIGNIVHAKTYIGSLSNGSSDGTSYWVIYNMPFAAQVEDYSGVALAYNGSPCNTTYVGDAGGNAILCVGNAPYTGSLSGEFMLNITYRVN